MDNSQIDCCAHDAIMSLQPSIFSIMSLVLFLGIITET